LKFKEKYYKLVYGKNKMGEEKIKKKKSRKTEKLKKNLFGVAYKTETELKSVLTIPFDSLLHHI
jgi:hypothetical protein